MKKKNPKQKQNPKNPKQIKNKKGERNIDHYILFCADYLRSVTCQSLTAVTNLNSFVA